METTRQYSFQTSLSCMMFEIFFVYCWCISCTAPEYLDIDGLCPFYAFSITIYLKKWGSILEVRVSYVFKGRTVIFITPTH